MFETALCCLARTAEDMTVTTFIRSRSSIWTSLNLPGLGSWGACLLLMHPMFGYLGVVELVAIYENSDCVCCDCGV